MNPKQLMGPHVSGDREGLTKTIPYLYEKGVRVFQIMWGSSRTLGDPSSETLEILKDYPSDIIMVAHGPFVVNMLSKDHKMWAPTLRYTAHALELCSRVGVSYYVSHMGAMVEGQTRESAFHDAYEFCVKLNKMTGELTTPLCIENDCGSSKGTKPANVPFVYKLVERLHLPGVGMVLDSEHAFAHGWDISDLPRVKTALKAAKLVHLNAVPHEVVFGKHLDRHSTTLLEGSSQVQPVLDIAKVALSMNIPMIFEREDYSYYVRDLQYMTECGLFEEVVDG